MNSRKKAKWFSVILLVFLLGYLLQASTRPAVPDYRSRTIYFILVDRFHDHHPKGHPYIDSKYPQTTNSIDCFTSHCESDAEYRKYWGGDIQGIIEKIGYLKALGIGALWVTPLMENIRAYVPGKGWGAAYHGYWVQNYDRVNRHFGSWQDVSALATVLHQNKMRYIQDITLNHSNLYDTHMHGALYQSRSSDLPFITSYQDDYDAIHQQHYYKHFQDDPRCKQTATLADGKWSYWQLHHCLLGTLSGYNQQDPVIRQYLIKAGVLWLHHGVDDFRLDAVKYVDPDFVAAFTRAIRGASKKTPYIVGEWSDGGVGNNKSLRFASQYSRYHTNLLDFQTAFALNRFIQRNKQPEENRESAQQLDQYLHRRVYDFHGRDTWQGVFLDNHDEIRSLVRLKRLGVDKQSNRKRRMDVGTVLMMTIRGIPIIYYGDEQYLANYHDHPNTVNPLTINSDDSDPYNRIGMQRWSQQTPAFKIIKTLATLRKKSTAIQKGQYKTVYASGDVLVFERIAGKDRVLVAVNRGKQVAISIPSLQLGIKQGRYKNALCSVSHLYASNTLNVKQSKSILHLHPWSAFVLRQSMK